MAKITKKARAVKTQVPPRYTIRKDSLGRRYSVDKRTGKRVPVARAQKERERRKKAIPQNVSKRKRQTKAERSAAAKKGWETRRKKALIPISEVVEAPLIPSDIKMRPLEGIQERSKRFSEVDSAAKAAWYRLQADAYLRAAALTEGREPPKLKTRRFDTDHGAGAAERIRFGVFARAPTLEDLDRFIQELLDREGDEYTAREIYTLYFSPEAA
jgi:hypothetical protein